MATVPKLRNVKPAIRTIAVAVAIPQAKRVDAHYQTPQHRVWRQQVLRNARWRCQAQGCGCAPGGKLFADHIVELQDGGDPVDPKNGQALCGAAHQRKTIERRAIRMAKPT